METHSDAEDGSSRGGTVSTGDASGASVVKQGATQGAGEVHPPEREVARCPWNQGTVGSQCTVASAQPVEAAVETAVETDVPASGEADKRVWRHGWHPAVKVAELQSWLEEVQRARGGALTYAP